MERIRRGYIMELNSWNYTEEGVVLDLLVTRNLKETLPVITVELHQKDEHENLKKIHYVPVDTAKISYGISSQISIPVKGIQLDEGDMLGMRLFKYPTEKQKQNYIEFEEKDS